jgi:hypothetical protein
LGCHSRHRSSTQSLVASFEDAQILAQRVLRPNLTSNMSLRLGPRRKALAAVPGLRYLDCEDQETQLGPRGSATSPSRPGLRAVAEIPRGAFRNGARCDLDRQRASCAAMSPTTSTALPGGRRFLTAVEAEAGGQRFEPVPPQYLEAQHHSFSTQPWITRRQADPSRPTSALPLRPSSSRIAV